jgi:hypothetical protein
VQKYKIPTGYAKSAILCLVPRGEVEPVFIGTRELRAVNGGVHSVRSAPSSSRGPGISSFFFYYTSTTPSFTAQAGSTFLVRLFQVARFCASATVTPFSRILYVYDNISTRFLWASHCSSSTHFQVSYRSFSKRTIKYDYLIFLLSKFVPRERFLNIVPGPVRL